MPESFPEMLRALREEVKARSLSGLGAGGTIAALATLETATKATKQRALAPAERLKAQRDAQDERSIPLQRGLAGAVDVAVESGTVALLLRAAGRLLRPRVGLPARSRPRAPEAALPAVASKLHSLQDIIAIAICGMICGADDWVSIEEFGQAKESWFRTFFDLPNGIPSHDTFGRVFAALDPTRCGFYVRAARASRRASGCRQGLVPTA